MKRYVKYVDGRPVLFNGVLRVSENEVKLFPKESDILAAGYEPLDESVDLSTISGIRAAAKVLAARLGIAVSALLLSVAPLLGASASTAKLEDMDLDTATVVTDVSFAGLASDADVSALASDVESRALQSHYAATSNDVATLGTSVSAVWEQVFGESVWIAVTNYMRSTDAKPSMGLWERRDGQTNLVWSSSEEIGARVDALRADVTNAVQSAQDASASAKAWGKWQSADGAAAPDGFTAVSTPYLMLTGGGHWEQRTVEGGWSYWLFCGNATVGGTDETFKMMDSQGESVFEVTQGGVKEVAAIPSSFRILSSADSDDDYLIDDNSSVYWFRFGVLATSEPTLYMSADPTGPWFEVTLPDGSWKVDGGTNYVVTFETPSPRWLGAYGQTGFTTNSTAAFFKAVYETGAESIVDFKRPLKFPKLSIGGTNYAVSVGTMEDGTKFLQLEGE